MAAAGDIAYPVLPEGLAWQNAALFGAATPTLDSVFDGLADYITQRFQPGVLQSLIDAS